MLKFAFFGLIGILLVTILTWISYLDSFHFHLGFTSFVYFVTWLTSCENDWELMGDRLSPGSEESQAVRITVDILMTLACWDYLDLGDIFYGVGDKDNNVGQDHTTKFWPILSCGEFITGSYLGCLAHLAFSRAVTNIGVGVGMLTSKLLERNNLIPMRQRQSLLDENSNYTDRN
ncbi:uncharacterized protein LOC118433694 [Folsomia candida]|uniref:uncharacterized protein LOC118433694 n=1 Tax=Folsomia candida TaxID=158441 RepID=UPI001604E9F8|nr:uncharacterized protein LOC118433694 [Folsomia candida]